MFVDRYNVDSSLGISVVINTYATQSWRKPND